MSLVNRVRCSVLKFAGLLLAVLTLADSLLFAQAKTSPFQPGERLTYDVTWSVFQAGTVSATLQSMLQGSKDDYAIVTTAHSQGFVSLLFDVDNEFRSVFNPKACAPRGFQKRSTKDADTRRPKSFLIPSESWRFLMNAT